MNKNITLSAQAELIEKARKRAAANGTTLNNEFREWLKSQTVTGDERLSEYKRLMKRLSSVDAGRSFSREEMNER
jgi:hypothetical protein